MTVGTEGAGCRNVTAPHVIALASGRRGVGRTSLVSNLAVALATSGRRTCVLDADLDRCDVPRRLGVVPARGLGDVLDGGARLAEVLVAGPAGVRVAAALPDPGTRTGLGSAHRLALLAAVDGLEDAVDVVLIDLAGGVSPDALYFSAAAAETLVVLTPDPDDVAEAKALLDALASRHGRREFLVVVNLAADADEARAVYRRLVERLEGGRELRVEWCGWVPRDAALGASGSGPAVLDVPDAPASRAIVQLASWLAARSAPVPRGGVEFFFQQRLTAERGR
jgi:flagellar biosynthesis protein FlhG